MPSKPPAVGAGRLSRRGGGSWPPQPMQWGRLSRSGVGTGVGDGARRGRRRGQRLPGRRVDPGCGAPRGTRGSSGRTRGRWPPSRGRGSGSAMARSGSRPLVPELLRCPERVALDPAVLPRVVAHPGAGRSRRPVAGQWVAAAGAHEVDPEPELMLRVAGPRGVRDRVLVPELVDSRCQDLDLLLVAPVRAPDADGAPAAAAASPMARRSSIATSRMNPPPGTPASVTGTRSGGT